MQLFKMYIMLCLPFEQLAAAYLKLLDPTHFLSTLRNAPCEQSISLFSTPVHCTKL